MYTRTHLSKGPSSYPRPGHPHQVSDCFAQRQVAAGELGIEVEMENGKAILPTV